MLEIYFLGLLGYYAIAALAYRYTVRRHPAIVRRPLARATLCTLLFSIAFLVGHGVAPVPAIALLAACPFGACERMFGSFGFVPWILLPMLVQWVLLVAAFKGWDAARGRAGASPRRHTS